MKNTEGRVEVMWDKFFLGLLGEDLMQRILSFCSETRDLWERFLAEARLRYLAGKMADAIVLEYERTNGFCTSKQVNIPFHILPPELVHCRTFPIFSPSPSSFRQHMAEA